MTKKSTRRGTPAGPIKCRPILFASELYRSVPLEVWILILSHLRNPLPAPLSRPPRSALRQPHLSSAALTCSLFYELSIPLLYTHILTDDLPSLIYANIDNSHLHLTKSLRIEYAEKTPTTSYRTIMKEGRPEWARLGQLQELMEECGPEVSRLHHSLGVLNEAKGQNFSALQSVGLCSIFGKEGDLWGRFDKWVEAGQPSGSSVAARFNELVQRLDIQHLCIRDGTGPLGKPPLSHADDTFNRTLHFGSDYSPTAPDFSELYFPFGRKIRWVSDVPGFHDSQPVLGGLTKRLGILMRDRTREHGHQLKKTDTADITIYSSQSHAAEDRFINDTAPRPPGSPMPEPMLLPAHDMDERAQRMLMGQMGIEVQHALRQSSGLEDKIRWHIRSETEICRSCGAGPPPDAPIPHIL